MSEVVDDIECTLSSDTLKALQEFRQEEQEREASFKQLYDAAQNDFENQKVMDLFKEDWQLSQFWYDEETADLLADALLDGADSDTVIAILSAPSVYAAIKKRPASSIPTAHIHLFEFDTRFEVLGGSTNFHFYDYNKPLSIPPQLKGKVHRFLIDPPFLNEECQSKFSTTTKALQHPDFTLKSKYGNRQHAIVSSTGERMAGVVSNLYPDIKVTDFRPAHAKGLSNEFRCYANFEWKGWKFE
ncbi:LAME_0H04852g1_1 [Lachancea meyersii CBS 8951]|uniref:Protein-lysine N-methyltransferase EFM5 n=1 Tax=Lachancea meyersii CBS 8951 TaxID=1266667 RepID=A0A1G4KE10_9SACH|nr:LAME_0H04852g1_1 [Lachancea meyersii CBS 8951]